MADTDLGKMSIDHREQCNNLDVIHLVHLLDNGLLQFGRSGSASRHDIIEADLNIMDGWLAHFKRQFELHAGQPELFMPKYAPKPLDVPPPPEVNVVQNGTVQHLLNHCAALRGELLFCESAARVSGFHTQQADVVVVPWIVKVESYLSQARGDLATPAHSWFPDADLQEPGVNVAEPR